MWLNRIFPRKNRVTTRYAMRKNFFIAFSFPHSSMRRPAGTAELKGPGLALALDLLY